MDVEERRTLIRTLYENYGHAMIHGTEFRLEFEIDDIDLIEYFPLKEHIHSHIRQGTIYYKDTYAVHVSEWMYHGCKNVTLKQDELMMKLNTEAFDFIFEYVLMHPDAIPPKRAHASDAGYDLTLLECTSIKGMLYMFDTCVSVKPPHGFYFDMVPRSSLSKTGYILANSVGVIDPSYQGTIKVPLLKIDPSAPDLELPNRYVQLIPRRTYFMTSKDVLKWDYTTERSDGGFGSTNTLLHVNCATL
jgi:deoxyuridine 5'-triphosphate nucleotidohydrolase